MADVAAFLKANRDENLVIHCSTKILEADAHLDESHTEDVWKKALARIRAANLENGEALIAHGFRQYIEKLEMALAREEHHERPVSLHARRHLTGKRDRLVAFAAEQGVVP